MEKLISLTFKAFLACAFLLFNQEVLACPGCAGSMGNEGDTNTVYVLMVFIALTYIPFFFIYKMIIKHKDLNNLKSLETVNYDGSK